MPQPIQHTRNKLIVLARKIWAETQDPDLSFRKLGQAFKIKGETAFDINQRSTKVYDFGVAFKVEKKKK